jgi:hypothetical protein
MVCKKNTGDLYWFGPRNALRSVGEESSVLSCTEVLVVGVTSGRERGRSSQVSRCEWRKWVCATLLVALQGLGELSARVVRCVVVVVLLLFSISLERSLHAPFIDSRRCRVTKCWHAVCLYWWRSLEASGGPYPVATWSILRRHGVSTSSTAVTCSSMCATAEGVVSIF